MVAGIEGGGGKEPRALRDVQADPLNGLEYGHGSRKGSIEKKRGRIR